MIVSNGILLGNFRWPQLDGGFFVLSFYAVLILTYSYAFVFCGTELETFSPL